MTTALIVLGAIAALVIAILLEGKRQARKYGKSSGRGASLLAAGMLDLQRHLEPERKVEILLEAPDEEARSASGAPPAPEPRRD